MAKQEEWFTFPLLNTSMKIFMKTHVALEPIKKKRTFRIQNDSGGKVSILPDDVIGREKKVHVNVYLILNG